MEIFAQAGQVPAESWKNAILIGLALIAGVSGITGIWSAFGCKRREIHPQPLEVKAAEPFVTKGECKTLHAETERRLLWLEGQMVELRRDMARDRETLGKNILEEVGKVHNRINDLLQAVSELKGRVES